MGVLNVQRCKKIDKKQKINNNIIIKDNIKDNIINNNENKNFIDIQKINNNNTNDIIRSIKKNIFNNYIVFILENFKDEFFEYIEEYKK